jgi:hypothetical protein
MLALLLEQKGHLTPDELRNLLFDCCAEFTPNDKNAHGKGLVSFTKLVK